VTYKISLTPETFTLVKYDAAALLAVAQDAAAAVGVPEDTALVIEVDEALPGPLIASASEAAPGRFSCWFSGGCFEDPKRQAELQPEMSKSEFGAAFLRARDRLDGGFEDAPSDSDISERQRAIWDVYADGRLKRLGGFLVNEARRRYTYRLRAGFNDVADAEYDRIWNADAFSWSELEAVEARLAAADPRPEVKKPIRQPSLRQS
jgi:hypothetical protein